MKGQLRATETAADAAFAALARPWLFITSPNANHREWLEGNAQMRVTFTIFNHGNAPAIILNIQTTLFLGEHHHNGTPEHLRPDDFISFPRPDDFARFIFSNGRPPATDKSVDGVERLFFLPAALSQALPASTPTEELVCLGPRQIRNSGVGIPVETLCDVYFLGRITYRLPSQGIETMNFSMKGRDSFFEIYRDYAPYNQRKSHPDIG